MIVDDDGAAVLLVVRMPALGSVLAVVVAEVLAVEELAAVLGLGVVGPAAAAGASPGRSSRRVRPSCNATARIRGKAPNEHGGIDQGWRRGGGEDRGKGGAGGKGGRAGGGDA